MRSVALCEGAKATALTTLVYPFDPATPTGLHVLVRQLVEALVARGESVRLVVAKPNAAGGWPDGAARESHQGLGARVEICWLPADTFDPFARERLCFALERLADDSALTPRGCSGWWVCFGIGASAFVASLVARRNRARCATFVVASDVLGRLLMHPDEVGATLGRSDRVLCANPDLLDPLATFFEPEIAILAREDRLAIVRPVAAAPPGEPVAIGDHVGTTGALGPLDDLTELIDRLVAEMRATGAKRWLHAGTIHPRIVGRLTSALAMRGLGAAFDATGLRDAAAHERHVRSSLVLLKAAGEVDTGLGVVEASRWGVRVSLPDGFPFAADGSLRSRSSWTTRVLAPETLAASLSP